MPSTVRPAALALAAAAAALALAGCGAGSSNTAHQSTGAHATDRPAAAGNVTVRISTYAFRPNPLRIHAGTKVTWVNADAIEHTVTSGTRTYFGAGSQLGMTKSIEKSGLFDMDLPGKGATASYTFTKPGTYHYLCDRHPGMDAEVVVS